MLALATFDHKFSAYMQLQQCAQHEMAVKKLMKDLENAKIKFFEPSLMTFYMPGNTIAKMDEA